MAKKKQPTEQVKLTPEEQNIFGLRPVVLEQPITETLETNYMPYAMSVIVSRAIPEIDGFKPSHRKLLYTMYKAGLLNGARTKSANIVGQTMKLNPHGDAAIYDTMVRLSKGNEALLVPFVDSKGNFGKAYSRDMVPAAPRYTEAKLSSICAELFRDIDKDAVDMIDNYDGTMKEPTLLPTTFPNVLVSSNLGIAVGMASNICGFNLGEVCETTIALLKDSEHDIMSTLPAPDFPTGGEILCSHEELENVYNTGRGGIRIRSRWRYDSKENIIEVYEIPYSTTVEQILDKVAELVKDGKLREISDMRDETDKNGLKLAIDLKRGTDPEKLMQKLFRLTPLQDSFACNFNILLNGKPKVCGVGEILNEWIEWRQESVRRRTAYDLARKKEKLHLLNGLKKILLDIDRAIEIIRNTEKEADVVPNLMVGFGIDQIQAEFVAEIKLRNINREYILKRVAETGDLENEIAELELTVGSKRRLRNIIAEELSQVMKKYPCPRHSIITYDVPEDIPVEEITVEDYPVHLFISKEGYFKKITPLSLRMSSEQKYKEGDGAFQYFETTNRAELLVFSNKAQVYKTKVSDFAETKASALGTYLPTHLEFDEGENFFAAVLPGNNKGHLFFFFENGKCARALLTSYETKTNRKRLTNAYSDKSPLKTILHLTAETKLTAFSSDGRALIFSSSQIAPKTTRDSQGVSVMTLKKNAKLEKADFLDHTCIQEVSRYSTRNIPAAGALLKEEDRGEKQMSLLE